jgi:D-inositol-3-phosphate glycosyltransferase
VIVRYFAPRRATPVADERLRSGGRVAAEPAGDGNHAGESREALMRVGALWSAFTLAGPADPFMSSGQHMAAAAWVRAMAQYASIPSIDIFTPIHSIDECRRQLRDIPSRVSGGAAAGARFLPESEIPACFEAATYDALHIPSGIDFPRLTYLRSRLSRRVFPVTCSIHGLSYSQDVLLCFIPLLTAHIRPCDAVVCLTESSRRAMEKRMADIAERYSRAWDRPVPPLPRLELIPWGVDTERFSLRDPAAARRDLNLPPDRTIVLCLGRFRIHDKMDWTPLLLAFDHAIRKAKQRPLLVLAGANPMGYGEQLLAQAAQLGLTDSVQAFFNLPPACLPSLYAACDIFVSPTDSPTESFGLTILEAMACGRPVVASDWDGYKDLIVHGETGFKVRTDWADCMAELNDAAPFLSWEHEHLHVGQSVSVDVPQMADYLAQLLQNRDLRQEMGGRARARVMTAYDWPVVIKQWEALWTELAAVATSLGAEPADSPDWLQPNYFEHFSHYASRIIDDAVPVQVTARGKALLAGKAPLWLHPWAQAYLRPELLRATLDALKSSGWLRAGVTVGGLVGVMNAVHRVRRDQALMHLLWLAKYDLVRLGEAQPSRSQPARAEDAGIR